MAGDLNNPPDSLHMSFMQSLLPSYQDVWVAANGTSLGPTANNPQNTYSEVFLSRFLLWYTLELCASTVYQHKFFSFFPRLARTHADIDVESGQNVDTPNICGV